MKNLVGFILLNFAFQSWALKKYYCLILFDTYQQTADILNKRIVYIDSEPKPLYLTCFMSKSDKVLDIGKNTERNKEKARYGVPAELTIIHFFCTYSPLLHQILSMESLLSSFHSLCMLGWRLLHLLLVL